MPSSNSCRDITSLYHRSLVREEESPEDTLTNHMDTYRNMQARNLRISMANDSNQRGTSSSLVEVARPHAYNNATRRHDVQSPEHHHVESADCDEFPGEDGSTFVYRGATRRDPAVSMRLVRNIIQDALDLLNEEDEEDWF